jgi:hypothetical protein
LRQYLSETEKLKWEMEPERNFWMRLLHCGYAKEGDREPAAVQHGSTDAAPESPGKGQAE